MYYTSQLDNIRDYLDSILLSRHDEEIEGKQEEMDMLFDVYLVMLCILSYLQVTSVTFVLQQVTSVTFVLQQVPSVTFVLQQVTSVTFVLQQVTSVTTWTVFSWPDMKQKKMENRKR